VTEIKVKPGNTVTVKVRGPAVVRIDDGTAPGGDQAAKLRATMPGLAEAIALLTARHHGSPSPGLSGDVPPAAATAALLIPGGAFLTHLVPGDRGARLLRDLGLIAASEDGTATGRDS
jgi:hypothetical protein